MSIMNRRNAVIGWATWAVFKQLLKRNAKAGAQVEEEKRSRRLRRKEQAAETQVEPKRKRGKRRVLGFLVAGAIGVGVWLSTRGKGKSDLE